jgi:hypothetical protein
VDLRAQRDRELAERQICGALAACVALAAAAQPPPLPESPRFVPPAEVQAPAIRIAVAAGSFTPVTMELASRHQPYQTRLQKTRPAGILKEPCYSGDTRYYGALKLGSPPRPFHFVLEEQRSWLGKPTQRLHFDRSGDGDLTNDGTPLVNRGSGSGGPGEFGTLIEIGWQTLVPGRALGKAFAEKPFGIWFFSNAGSSARR